MLRLSVIIPVYNVADFVERCIRSVAQQDIVSAEYEIIVVDDGSSDHLLEILRKLEAEYDNLIVISKQNEGVGAARNTGIKAAKGKYLWFVDGDDFIKPDCLALLLSKVESEDLDALAFSFQCVNEAGHPIKWYDCWWKLDGSILMSGEEYYAHNYKENFSWVYLFRTELFHANAIEFRDRMKLEDSEILPRIFRHVDRMRFLNEDIYFYVKRATSALNSIYPDDVTFLFYSLLDLHKYLWEFRERLAPNSILYHSLDLKLAEISKAIFFTYLYVDFGQHLEVVTQRLIQSGLHSFPTIKGHDFHHHIFYNLMAFFLKTNPYRTKKIYNQVKYVWVRKKR